MNGSLVAVEPAQFRVQELAQSQGLSFEDLSRKSGVQMSTLARIWRGYPVDPRYSTLRALALALGVTVDGLEVKEEPKPGKIAAALMAA